MAAQGGWGGWENPSARDQRRLTNVLKRGGGRGAAGSGGVGVVDEAERQLHLALLGAELHALAKRAEAHGTVTLHLDHDTVETLGGRGRRLLCGELEDVVMLDERARRDPGAEDVRAVGRPDLEQDVLRRGRDVRHAVAPEDGPEPHPAGLAARHDDSAREGHGELLRLAAARGVFEVREAVAVVVDAVAADLGGRRQTAIIGALRGVAAPLVALAVAALLERVAIGVGRAHVLVALAVAAALVGVAFGIGGADVLVALAVAAAVAGVAVGVGGADVLVAEAVAAAPVGGAVRVSGAGDRAARVAVAVAALAGAVRPSVPLGVAVVLAALARTVRVAVRVAAGQHRAAPTQHAHHPDHGQAPQSIN